MFRPRRLIWLVVIGVIGYFVWRWRQDQAATPPAPAMAPSPPPARGTVAPPTVADAPADAPPSAPRRIATRVHRGAPPAMPLPAAPAAPTKAAEEPPAAPTAPPAVVEQTRAPISAEEIPASDAALGGDSAQAPAGPVNINTAESQALIDLPGIGPALAARIIAHREQNGPFATIEQLVDVQGIGPNNINEFRHLVTV